jgi:hypothetical protein
VNIHRAKRQKEKGASIRMTTRRNPCPPHLLVLLSEHVSGGKSHCILKVHLSVHFL